MDEEYLGKEVRPARRGEKSSAAKLTDAQAAEIALDFITPNSQLARKHRVSTWTIQRLRKGKTYLGSGRNKN